MTEFDMTFEGWRKTAQKVGRWSRRVEEGAEADYRSKYSIVDYLITAVSGTLQDTS